MAIDQQLIDAQNLMEERFCRFPSGDEGIIEKIIRGRSIPILKAKVIMDSGVIRYTDIANINVR